MREDARLLSALDLGGGGLGVGGWGLGGEGWDHSLLFCGVYWAYMTENQTIRLSEAWNLLHAEGPRHCEARFSF